MSPSKHDLSYPLWATNETPIVFFILGQWTSFQTEHRNAEHYNQGMCAICCYKNSFEIIHSLRPVISKLFQINICYIHYTYIHLGCCCFKKSISKFCIFILVNANEMKMKLALSLSLSVCVCVSPSPPLFSSDDSPFLLLPCHCLFLLSLSPHWSPSLKVSMFLHVSSCLSMSQCLSASLSQPQFLSTTPAVLFIPFRLSPYSLHSLPFLFLPICFSSCIRNNDQLERVPVRI